MSTQPPSLHYCEYEPIVAELAHKIKTESGWRNRFDLAIQQAKETGVREMSNIHGIEDFYSYCNDWLFWIPSENIHGTQIYKQLLLFYFVFQQKAVREYQNSILPGDGKKQLTWLSNWLLRYAITLGNFLDTPESLTPDSLLKFYASPSYNMSEYIQPHGGWKTFNQLFARNFKPGYRPIAAILDSTVIVAATDSRFCGHWEIRSDSGVTIKNLHWQISELLSGSPYAGSFKNGTFMHSFLGPSDYHRQVSYI